ncbi:hypothetical protein BJX63DRAFT_372746 [Aspergillus granulosus]|uniref:Uncharacterized protein n=1 Tax=Aspergillus granulosus TaxID=176169 RepID=A0ABR4H2D6_9EURO
MITNPYYRMICLDELPLIPVQTIAFVLWQLDNLGVAARFSRNMNPGLLCIEGFTSSWGKQELPSFFSINGVEVLALYFQLRWMKVGTNDLHNRGITDGILLQRDEGDLPNTHGNEPRDLKIREERHGFAMITTVDRAFPLYTLVNLANNMRILVGGEEDLYLDRKLQNMTARSYLRHNMMGLGMFLIFLSGTLEWIASQWINSLDQLDRTLHTSLAQMTREKRRTLMFDDDLSKSDQYFAVLQTLHMCTDWINGTLRDVRELCDNIEPILSARVDAVEIDRESLDALCGAVVADSEMHFQPLLDRIERKVEEVKGLRDGIFVTSVKKASKGTGLAENSRQQIRYILVFTVAIVFYLPMGFVTSFFGMHLFNLNDNPTASQTSFIIAFIVLSIAIYAIATGALLVVRDDEWVKTTLASWKLVATSLGIPSQRLPWPGSFNLFNKKKSGKEGAL